MKKLSDLFKDVIQKHVENFVAGDEPKDYIDSFLSEYLYDFNFTDDVKTNLAANMYDIFVAGSETTSKTMCWVLLYMATHPDVQDKVIFSLNFFE